MFDFIPLEHYTVVFYYVILLLVLLLFFNLVKSQKLKRSNLFQFIFVFGLLFYIGLRPISGWYSGDMRTYANYFESYLNGYTGTFEQDPGFDWFMRSSSLFLTVELFFLVVAFFYVYSHYWAAKRFFKEYWFYAFIMFAGSFSFWSYGTNGLRNGLAAALLLLALSFEKKKLLLSF